MRLFVFIAGLMLAAPAFAQTKAVLAECATGGCRCNLSEATGLDAATLFGTDLPDGWEDMVLVSADGSYFWSAASREDIDTAYGGDGQCDLELFAALVPEDGLWVGTAGKGKVGQCPAGLREQLQPQLDSIAIPRKVKWGGTFDPDAIVMGGKNTAITWTGVRPDYFTGTAVTNGGAGANAAVSISVDYTATLLSPTRMDGTVALRVKAKGGNQAILAQLGMADCKVDVPIEFAKTGG